MKPEKIIIHHSLTKDDKEVSWNAIRRYHKNTLSWRDIGYHFGIERIGDRYEILLGRMLHEQGAHTKGHNKNSIGICFIGNFDKNAPPKSQWALGVRLVKSLQYLFDIRYESVKGHHHYNRQKSCPGKHFNMEAFINDIK